LAAFRPAGFRAATPLLGFRRRISARRDSILRRIAPASTARLGSPASVAWRNAISVGDSYPGSQGCSQGFGRVNRPKDRLGSHHARARAPDSIAALAGCTPVTKASGKHEAVHFRWACNKRFRVAITTFADNSRHASPWAAKIYNDARTAGKDHPLAVPSSLV
jgi:hypothetical protein